MSVRDALRKAAGLLVELPPEEPQATVATAGQGAPELDRLFSQLNEANSAQDPGTPPIKTVDQIVRDTAGPSLDEIKGSTPSTPVVASDGTVDLAVVYSQANLPPAPFAAEQVMELLANLPPELPMETRRQTIKVTLNAMGKATGASSESVVADATRKLAALAACTDQLGRQTSNTTATLEREIGELQSQIEEKRRAIESAKQQLAAVTKACETESHRLDDVLEFFSLDVAPSKYAPGGP
jgi:hypothetical protein